MKPSRNAPCPCGSGKKYKKCCGFNEIAVPASQDKIKDHFLTEAVPSSDPIPDLSESYFQNLDTSDIVAAKLLYSNILHPEIEDIVSTATSKFLTRAKLETEQIKISATTDQLISIMKNGSDILNNSLLKSRFLEKPSEAVAMLIVELQHPVDDNFVELAIQTLAQAKIDISNELIDIIERHDKSAYQLSSLCLLLGFYDNLKVPQLLWNHLNYFQSNFPQEDYWRGPFYGLWEFWERNIFDKTKH